MDGRNLVQLAFEGDEALFVLSEGYGVPVEGKACRTNPLNQCEKDAVQSWLLYVLVWEIRRCMPCIWLVSTYPVNAGLPCFTAIESSSVQPWSHGPILVVSRFISAFGRPD